MFTVTETEVKIMNSDKETVVIKLLIDIPHAEGETGKYARYFGMKLDKDVPPFFSIEGIVSC
jgi:hypothetical protein